MPKPSERIKEIVDKSKEGSSFSWNEHFAVTLNAILSYLDEQQTRRDGITTTPTVQETCNQVTYSPEGAYLRRSECSHPKETCPEHSKPVETCKFQGENWVCETKKPCAAHPQPDTKKRTDYIFYAGCKHDMDCEFPFEDQANCNCK